MDELIDRNTGSELKEVSRLQAEVAIPEKTKPFFLMRLNNENM